MNPVQGGVLTSRAVGLGRAGEARNADPGNFAKQTGIPESELLGVAAEARHDGVDPGRDGTPVCHSAGREAALGKARRYPLHARSTGRSHCPRRSPPSAEPDS
jgi:hypothetical protein